MITPVQALPPHRRRRPQGAASAILRAWAMALYHTGDSGHGRIGIVRKLLTTASKMRYAESFCSDVVSTWIV